MTAPLALLEEFADDGHRLECPDRRAIYPEELEGCDCAAQAIAVARATRQALERTPPRMVIDLPASVVDDARRAFAARGEVGDPEDPLILIRQLRAVLGAMFSPAPFGKQAVTGLHVYGRVLDQLQAYVLEWGAFALEHPDRIQRPT